MMADPRTKNGNADVKRDRILSSWLFLVTSSCGVDAEDNLDLSDE